MNTKTYAVTYLTVGVFLLFVLHLIRKRLRTNYPEVFAKLGDPTYMDSNLGRTYWKFQGFVWWGHFSLRRDLILHAMCLAALIAQVVIILLFVFQFAVVPSTG